MIRQPVSISFDERGRMWVLQYLQYPNSAGLKPVKQDQYLRTIWDSVPEPPPQGPKGADASRSCYDPDENGVFRKSKDFVTGLNLATGFCLGNGGVYVVQPPYLLFYPDKNHDDVPDGDPEVLLTGFGMEDTHSLANSLQWGPDGWLYGAAGSTEHRARSRTPPNPKEQSSSSSRASGAITRRRSSSSCSPRAAATPTASTSTGTGRCIAGTNWGGFAMLHQVQGAYYVKGFAKHGPLHNPHTYGYFDHVPYTGFKGGHVTCGGIVYQADTYPKEFHDQYIAGNLLSNAIYWHKLEPNEVDVQGRARRRPDRRPTTRGSARSICCQGPDGCVYVADWYDQPRRPPRPGRQLGQDQRPHLPHRVQGRAEVRDVRPAQEDLGRARGVAEAPEQVVARTRRGEILAERQDKSVHPKLRKWLLTETGQIALESLWTLYATGGWMERDFDAVEAHANEIRPRLGGPLPRGRRNHPIAASGGAGPHGVERAQRGRARATRVLREAAARRTESVVAHVAHHG